MRWGIMRGLLLGVVACSAETLPAHGSVTLAMSTDLTIDDDIATVGLYVQQLDGGRVLETWGWTENANCNAGTCEIKFPATFVLESSGKSSTLVKTRVVGFDKHGAAVVMRDARFQVDTRQASAVRVPLLWINSGIVSDTTPGGAIAGGSDGALPFDPFARFGDGCAEGQTRDERGECVDTQDLGFEPHYEPDAGLGDDKLACLDPGLCFGDGERRFRTAGLLEQPGGCSIEVPAAVDAASVNVALVVPAGQPGYLVDDLRIRPLAIGSSAEACQSGRCASGTTSGAENLFFPAAVCKKLHEVGGPTPELLVSTRCASHTASEPICASWNLTGDAVSPAAPRPPATDTDATTFEITGVGGNLTGVSSQGDELVVTSREPSGAVVAHRFVAPPFAPVSAPHAANALYTLPAGSSVESVRVSTPRKNLGPASPITEYSEAYALAAPDQIIYLPPGAATPVPVRLAIDCNDPNDHWKPYLGHAKIQAVSMARIDATAKDLAARLEAITAEGGVGGLVTPKALGALALGIVSFTVDDDEHPGQVKWKNTVGVVGSPLLSGQLHFGGAANITFSSPDPTCIQVFKTDRHDGDPGSDRCEGLDGSTCCHQSPCAGVFDGAGGALGLSTEIAPNELGNFIPFDTSFAAADPLKQFRWCGMEDAQYIIDSVGEAVLGGGQLTNLPATAISCFNEYFDYTKGPLSVGSLAIGGGFRSPDDQDDRKLFALLDPTQPTRRLTSFETQQSLFLKDETGQYVRTEQGNRQHQERQWREIEGKVFAPPAAGTRIVSYSDDGGTTNVVCYVAETPTVACYDQDGKPVALPLDTGFIDSMQIDDTNLSDAENNLYIALQCKPENDQSVGRVFAYRVPWTSLTGSSQRDPLPNPCRR